MGNRSNALANGLIEEAAWPMSQVLPIRRLAGTRSWHYFTAQLSSVTIHVWSYLVGVKNLIDHILRVPRYKNSWPSDFPSGSPPKSTYELHGP